MKYSIYTNLAATTANQMRLDCDSFTPYSSSQSTEFMNNFKKYVAPSLDNVEVGENGDPIGNK